MINRAEDGSRRRRCPFSACLWARPARSPRRPRSSRRSCRWGCRGRRSAGARLHPARPRPAAALAPRTPRPQPFVAAAQSPPGPPPPAPRSPARGLPAGPPPRRGINEKPLASRVGRGVGDSRAARPACPRAGLGMLGRWGFLFGNRGERCWGRPRGQPLSENPGMAL